MAWIAPQRSTSNGSAAEPSLEEARRRAMQRVAEFEQKIALSTNQLRTLRDQITISANDTARQKMLRTRATATLRQRALYEGQRDRAEGQARNLEQQQCSITSLEDTRLAAEAMRGAHASMERHVASSSLSLDTVTETMYSMQGLMSDQAELENVLAEPFGGANSSSQELDDAALDAELDALTPLVVETPVIEYPSTPVSAPQPQVRPTHTRSTNMMPL